MGEAQTDGKCEGERSDRCPKLAESYEISDKVGISNDLCPVSRLRVPRSLS